MTDYQRKSGDVFTFIGNTLVSMIIICNSYDLSKSYGGIFGGDDSLIMMPQSEIIFDWA